MTQFIALPPVIGIAPSSTVPPGPIPTTNTQSVYVNGDASISADTTVNGDLVVNGTLSNVGGFAVSVTGDVFVADHFNFTPTLTNATQGNFTIGGDLSVNSNNGNVTSTFNVNKGQAPVLFVGGDFYNANANGIVALDGSGRAEALGLTINVGGDVSGMAITTSGGASAGVAKGGNSGLVTIQGDAANVTFTCNGGDCAFANFNGGISQGLTALGDVIIAGACTFDGGDVSVGTGHGGTCFSVTIGGDLVAFGGGTSFSSDGGSTNGSGAGASSTGIAAGGSISNVAISSKGGNSGSGNGGDGGQITTGGTLTPTSLDVSGGTGGTPGNNGSVLVVPPILNGSTGAGTALLGAANCPAVTVNAVHTWLTFTATDGSVLYVPAWK